MMFDIKKLTPTFAVSAQISISDLNDISRMGFKSVINNRPDGEATDQICSTLIEQKCHQLGLEYTYLPVISGAVTQQSVAQFQQQLQSLPQPILAFCRTGTRSSILWVSCSETPELLDKRLRSAAIHGYQFNPQGLPLMTTGE